MRPKQTQRISTFHAHESILDTLLEVYQDNKYLGAAEISKRTGFFRKQPMNDAIVTGFLFELEDLKKVYRHESKWALTEEEYNKRKEE